MCSVLYLLSRFALEFSRHTSIKIPEIEFQDPVGAEMFHRKGQPDGQEKSHSRFSNLAYAPIDSAFSTHFAFTGFMYSKTNNRYLSLFYSSNGFCDGNTVYPL